MFENDILRNYSPPNPHRVDSGHIVELVYPPPPLYHGCVSCCLIVSCSLCSRCQIPLQFCDQDSEDEVFFGKICNKEKKKSEKYSKRRTVVFTPGFRKSHKLMRYTIDRANKELRAMDAPPTLPETSVIHSVPSSSDSSNWGSMVSSSSLEQFRRNRGVSFASLDLPEIEGSPDEMLPAKSYGEDHDKDISQDAQELSLDSLDLSENAGSDDEIMLPAENHGQDYDNGRSQEVSLDSLDSPKTAGSDDELLPSTENNGLDYDNARSQEVSLDSLDLSEHAGSANEMLPAESHGLDSDINDGSVVSSKISVCASKGSGDNLRLKGEEHKPQSAAMTYQQTTFAETPSINDIIDDSIKDPRNDQALESVGELVSDFNSKIVEDHQSQSETATHEVPGSSEEAPSFTHPPKDEESESLVGETGDDVGVETVEDCPLQSEVASHESSASKEAPSFTDPPKDEESESLVGETGDDVEVETVEDCPLQSEVASHESSTPKEAPSFTDPPKDEESESLVVEVETVEDCRLQSETAPHELSASEEASPSMKPENDPHDDKESKLLVCETGDKVGIETADDCRSPSEAMAYEQTCFKPAQPITNQENDLQDNKELSSSSSSGSSSSLSAWSSSKFFVCEAVANVEVVSESAEDRIKALSTANTSEQMGSELKMPAVNSRNDAPEVDVTPMLVGEGGNTVRTSGETIKDYNEPQSDLTPGHCKVDSKHRLSDICPGHSSKDVNLPSELSGSVGSADVELNSEVAVGCGLEGSVICKDENEDLDSGLDASSVDLFTVESEDAAASPGVTMRKAAATKHLERLNNSLEDLFCGPNISTMHGGSMAETERVLKASQVENSQSDVVLSPTVTLRKTKMADMISPAPMEPEREIVVLPSFVPPPLEVTSPQNLSELEDLFPEMQITTPHELHRESCGAFEVCTPRSPYSLNRKLFPSLEETQTAESLFVHSSSDAPRHESQPKYFSSALLSYIQKEEASLSNTCKNEVGNQLNPTAKCGMIGDVWRKNQSTDDNAGCDVVMETSLGKSKDPALLPSNAGLLTGAYPPDNSVSTRDGNDGKFAHTLSSGAETKSGSHEEEPSEHFLQNCGDRLVPEILTVRKVLHNGPDQETSTEERASVLSNMTMDIIDVASCTLIEPDSPETIERDTSIVSTVGLETNKPQSSTATLEHDDETCTPATIRVGVERNLPQVGVETNKSTIETCTPATIRVGVERNLPQVGVETNKSTIETCTPKTSRVGIERNLPQASKLGVKTNKSTLINAGDKVKQAPGKKISANVPTTKKITPKRTTPCIKCKKTLLGLKKEIVCFL